MAWYDDWAEEDWADDYDTFLDDEEEEEEDDELIMLEWLDDECDPAEDLIAQDPEAFKLFAEDYLESRGGKE